MKLHLAKEVTQVTVTNYLMKMIRFPMQRRPERCSRPLPRFKTEAIKQSVNRLLCSFSSVCGAAGPSKLEMAEAALRKGLLLIKNG